MRDFYIYWCYSTFYMFTFSYRAYMGFICYLCAYIHNREKRKNGKGTPAEGKRKKRAEERSIK